MTLQEFSIRALYNLYTSGREKTVHDCEACFAWTAWVGRSAFDLWLNEIELIETDMPSTAVH